jgi:hypothetical protein
MPQRRAQPRATTARLVVRDRSGTALGDVRVVVSGPVSQEVVTDASGTASVGTIRDGSYRLRFERDGFITLEREIMVSNGQPPEIAVALSAAPGPPPPPRAGGAPAPPASSYNVVMYSRNRRAQRSRFSSLPPPRSGEHIS